MAPKIFFLTSRNSEIERIYNSFPNQTDMVRHFHDLRRFLQKYRTNNISEADFAFLDINIVLFQFYNSKEIRGKYTDPSAYFPTLEEIKAKLQILVYSPGDFGQRALSPYEAKHEGKAYPEYYKWIDEKVSLLVWESTTGMFSKDIALLPFGSVPFWTKLRISVGSRRLKYSFAGNLIQPFLPPEHIRGGRFEQLRGFGPNWFVGDSSEIVRTGLNSVFDLILNSDFTLCPAGYGRWSYRFYQSLKLGSIPVLISDGYQLPNWLPWDWNELVVVWPENSLSDLPLALLNWNLKDIQARQEKIRSIQKFIRKQDYFNLLLKHLEEKPWVQI